MIPARARGRVDLTSTARSGSAPWRRLGESGDVGQVMIAYLIGAAVMAVGGVAELILGIRAEQQSLENIAKPLTAEEAEGGEEGEGEEEPDVRARREAAERAERRHRARPERERRGSRRYRLGPGAASYSPFLPAPAGPQDPAWLDREVEIIGRALIEGGQLSSRELARRTGARFWGPGRFRAALREAVAEGAARRAGRNVYAPGDAAPQAEGGPAAREAPADHEPPAPGSADREPPADRSAPGSGREA